MEYLLNGDSFGKKLTHYRKKRGLTRLKLAALAEISVFELMDIENGVQRKIPAELANKFCGLLNITLETLFAQA